MKAWLWRQAEYIPAYLFIVLYFSHERDLVYLFAATWSIVHVKGNEILEAVKKDREVGP